MSYVIHAFLLNVHVTGKSFIAIFLNALRRTAFAVTSKFCFCPVILGQNKIFHRYVSDLKASVLSVKPRKERQVP